MDVVDKLIANRPAFHASETEITRKFDPGESCLPRQAAQRLASVETTCYGIGNDVLRFLAAILRREMRTLETGAGCSTLVFADKGSRHTAITPSEAEIQRITNYATKHMIVMQKVRFVALPSEAYLPTCEDKDLDLVLLDGKHAFPWPIVDWFFVADRLKEGGLLLLDDTQMRSVSLLVEFLNAEPGWKFFRDFSGKTIAFQKTKATVLDVAWHMQPWNKVAAPPQPSILNRVHNRIKRQLYRT